MGETSQNLQSPRILCVPLRFLFGGNPVLIGKKNEAWHVPLCVTTVITAYPSAVIFQIVSDLPCSSCGFDQQTCLDCIK